MKTTDKILYSPKEGTTGFRGLRNVPKEPNSNSPAYHPIDSTLYEKALESCKSNSLEIVNPDVFQMIWDRTTQQIKPGDIFDLPEGYEFKQEEMCGSDVCPDNGQCEHCREPKKVLRLVKTETKDFEWKDDMKLFDKKIDVAHIGHGQPEPEESQDEIWDEAYHSVLDTLVSYSRDQMTMATLILERLRNDYDVTIQRKKQ